MLYCHFTGGDDFGISGSIHMRDSFIDFHMVYVHTWDNFEYILNKI